MHKGVSVGKQKRIDDECALCEQQAVCQCGGCREHCDCQPEGMVDHDAEDRLAYYSERLEQRRNER